MRTLLLAGALAVAGFRDRHADFRCTRVSSSCR